MSQTEQRRVRGEASGFARRAGRPRLPPISTYQGATARVYRRPDDAGPFVPPLARATSPAYAPFDDDPTPAGDCGRDGDCEAAAGRGTVPDARSEPSATPLRGDAGEPADVHEEPSFDERSAFLKASALPGADALSREIRDLEPWEQEAWGDVQPLAPGPVRARGRWRYAVSRITANGFGRRCVAGACVLAAVALTAVGGSLLGGSFWHKSSPDDFVVAAVPKIAPWASRTAAAGHPSPRQRARLEAHKRHAAKIALAAVNPPPPRFSGTPESTEPPAAEASASGQPPAAQTTPRDAAAPATPASAIPAAAAAEAVENTRPADLDDNPKAPMPTPGGIGGDHATTQLVSFDSAPFPYTGAQPGGRPFLDAEQFGRKGHRTWHGILWADPTYADNKVLVHIPAAFDPQRPGVIVVFFHGYEATLTRDVLVRQQVPAQVSESGANAVLLAPQFAVDARDSSAGRFWEHGGFRRFLAESAKTLARLKGDPSLEAKFAAMPVVIVGYSGGFVPAAWALQDAGTEHRVRGVLLLDAVYGELDKFAEWAAANRSGFLVSAFTRYTQYQNADLQRRLVARNVGTTTTLETDLSHGGATFLSTGPEVHHADFVTQAWTAKPIRDVLARLPDLRPVDAQTASIAH